MSHLIKVYTVCKFSYFLCLVVKGRKILPKLLLLLLLSGVLHHHKRQTSEVKETDEMQAEDQKDH